MAIFVSLSQIWTSGRHVLFDTGVLVKLYAQGTGGPDHDAFTSVLLNRRWVIPPVLWEFHGPRVGLGDRVNRRRWLEREGFQTAYGVDRPGIPGPLCIDRGSVWAVWETYLALAGLRGARGDPVDGLPAACTIAAYGQVVIATQNTAQFCWHPAACLVREWAAPTKCA